MASYRPSKHLFVASEDLPARFRPANQVRLVPASPANPQLAASMLPGMGGVQSGNGMSSLGLQSGAADRRLSHAIAVSRKNAAISQRTAQLAALEGKRPGRNQLAGLGSAGRSLGDAGVGLDALQVSFSWAGDSIAATRQKIIEMYALRPLKAWGHLQTFVTTAFGSDMQALQDALSSQPIVSIYDIQPYMPLPPTVDLNAPAEPTWEYVRTIPRPAGADGAVSRWIICKMVTPSGTRFAVTLYRTEGDLESQVVRSDNLATEADGIEYIRSYEVKTGDISDAGHAHRTVFWNSFLRGNRASGMQRAITVKPLNSTPAAAVDASNGSPASAAPAPAAPASAGTNGLGALDGDSMFVAGIAILGAIYLMMRADRPRSQRRFSN